MPNDAITTAEVAALLGVDRRTVHRMVAAGTLSPTLKLPGRTGALLFARADVEALAVERAS